MNLKKNHCLITVAIIFLCGGLGIYVYNDIPLRTSIFRSLMKGDGYIISEADTVYSFGHYGIRKWLIKEDDSLELLAENSSFTHNVPIGWLIARGGVVYGDYLYVSCRSYLGGPTVNDNKNYINGKLLILNKYDLDIIKEYISDIKFIEAKIHQQKLIVSGLKGFDVYDISSPLNPHVVYKYRNEKFTEFQGFVTYNVDTCSYIAFARFAEGLSIWDMTSPENIYPVADISIQDSLINGKVLPMGLQTCNLVLDYPYIYATISSIAETFNTQNDRRGIMTYDISDLNHIKQNFVCIPKGNWAHKRSGDPQPTFIDIFRDKIYINSAEKGIAVFDVSNPEKPVFIEMKNIADNNINYVYPIHITQSGVLLVGSQYLNKIYCIRLNN